MEDQKIKIKAEIRADGVWVFPADDAEWKWLRDRGIEVLNPGAYKLQNRELDAVYPENERKVRDFLRRPNQYELRPYYRPPIG